MAGKDNTFGGHAPLTPDALRNVCFPASLGVRSTDDLEPVNHLVGQDRALRAIAFGTKIRKAGFNLFALGAPGSGRHSAIRDFLDDHAREEEPGGDWVYVNNFASPHKPRALHLPRGKARELHDAMAGVIDDLLAGMPAAFEAEDYQSRRRAVDHSFEQQQDELLSAVKEKAEAENITIMRTPMGFALAPVHEGEPIRPEVFKAKPKAEQERIQGLIQSLQEELARALRQLPKLQKAHRDELRKLDKDLARTVVDASLETVFEMFAEHEKVRAYLDAVKADMVESFFLFLPQPSEDGSGLPALHADTSEHPRFRRYGINIIVGDNGETDGAPVIAEDLPSLPNLIGRVEYLSQMGTMVTDFMLIKPGALHRANGGYLIIDARRILSDGLAWNALKRSLQSHCIKIESAAEHLGMASPASLDPDPIPLDVKVVLVGERMLYHLAYQHDPDFQELFKVEAEFDEELDRTEDNVGIYARLVATVVKRENLKTADVKAVARIIDESSRMAEDAERLSLRIGLMADILREADFWAGERGARRIGLADVERAIAEQHNRSGRIREKSLEYILRETVRIETDTEAVGQINGLSVLQLGNMQFGKPTRITARVRVGSGEVVDIEREVALGGPIHSKGVLILSSYLASHYARDFPVSLDAGLVFEQSYGGVDGDSASSTELYALMSALSGVPIRQGLAVTGSVDQFGNVQAIGGANDKIEGFFDICSARGLTGRQGVLIPASNVKNLMLRPDVVEAAKRKRFHVFAVEHVDQGIEILTGRTAGTRGADGKFPPDTINARVEARLRSFAETRKAFAAKNSSSDKESGHG